MFVANCDLMPIAYHYNYMLPSWLRHVMPCMPGSLYIILMCVHTERERGWTYSNNLYIHMYNTPLPPTYCIYIYIHTPPHIQIQKYSQCTTLPSRHHPRSCPVGHGRYIKRVRSSQELNHTSTHWAVFKTRNVIPLYCLVNRHFP